jgi:hypothetical protein
MVPMTDCGMEKNSLKRSRELRDEQPVQRKGNESNDVTLLPTRDGKSEIFISPPKAIPVKSRMRKVPVRLMGFLS